ncbi:hypothetical protein RKLH11_506 [Rhodobacteraceae bacterium KLH11]|nr:hypothetical protein RKLH11_506 [Rhodobacteraceae bacterium KLH11]
MSKKPGLTGLFHACSDKPLTAAKSAPDGFQTETPVAPA